MTDIGDDLSLKNKRKLQARNNADSNWVEMLSVSKADEVVQPVRPRVRKYVFTDYPRCMAKAGAGAATGTAADINLINVNGLEWCYVILGTQTIVGPTATATGLSISLDQTDDDGIELRPMILANSANPDRFVVGTDPAFYASLKFKIADVSGTDDCIFGFRKLEADQAAVDDYDEMAGLNVISGNITIETILNAGATTSTDTTDNWADAATHTLKVMVSAAGVVTYEIDALPPTATAAFTFDDGEVLVPFLFFLHSSDVAGAVELIELEIGHL